MKKTTALILALIMCVSLASCKPEEEEIVRKEIVGEWIAVAINAQAVFREDGTGELTMDDATQSVTWKYEASSDSYTVTGEKTYKALFATEYDIDYVIVDGIDFCHAYDYDGAYTVMITRHYEDISALTESMTKVELDSVYDLGNDVSVQFIDVTKSSDGSSLQLTANFINGSDATVKDILPLTVSSKCYLADHAFAVTATETLDWSFAQDGLAAMEIITETVDLFRGENIDKTLLLFNDVVGAVYFEMNGTQYYFDLTDWF